VLSVLLNVELVDGLTIEKNLTGEGVVEALEQLNTVKSYINQALNYGCKRTHTVLFPQPLAPTRAT
jgi:hypothetical protein